MTGTEQQVETTVPAAGFAEVVETYRDPITGYLTRCGVDTASRADLLQEIFIKLHRLCVTQAGPLPRVLVFTVAANTTRSYFRRQAVQRRVFSEALPPEQASAAASSQELVEAMEAAIWLTDAIARLSLLQREVLVLTCFHHLDQNELAAVLGIPVGSVKTHLRRARLSLAKEVVRRKLRARREIR